MIGRETLALGALLITTREAAEACGVATSTVVTPAAIINSPTTTPFARVARVMS
jgi:hypothetical protein